MGKADNHGGKGEAILPARELEDLHGARLALDELEHHQQSEQPAAASVAGGTRPLKADVDPVPAGPVRGWQSGQELIGPEQQLVGVEHPLGLQVLVCVQQVLLQFGVGAGRGQAGEQLFEERWLGLLFD